MADIKKVAGDLKEIAVGTDQHKDGMNKKRAAMSGACVGLVVGIVMTFVYKWNWFYSIAGGAAIGGVAAGVITPKD